MSSRESSPDGYSRKKKHKKKHKHRDRHDNRELSPSASRHDYTKAARSRSRSPETDGNSFHSRRHTDYDGDSREHGERRRKENGRDYPSRSTGHSRVKSEPDDRGYEKYARPDNHQHRERHQHREGDQETRDGSHDRRGSKRRRDEHNMREQNRERQFHDRQRRDARRRRENSREPDVWGQPTHGSDDDNNTVPQEKEKPNFEISGKLTEDTNTYRGVVIKYNEPPEARKPRKRWRLYPFKGDESLPMLPIHRQSAYLLGRDRKVADIPTDHPSCSKQHAVFQYRLVEYDRADGSTGRRVRPYVIDLNSANGTYVNNTRIEPQRYVELIEKDVVKFGFSSREYVVLHEQVKGGEEEDVEPEEADVQE